MSPPIVLFMGSQKYPGENEFDSFVTSHGGNSNACTGYELVRPVLQHTWTEKTFSFVTVFFRPITVLKLIRNISRKRLISEREGEGGRERKFFVFKFLDLHIFSFLR